MNTKLCPRCGCDNTFWRAGWEYEHQKMCCNCDYVWNPWDVWDRWKPEEECVEDHKSYKD